VTLEIETNPPKMDIEGAQLSKGLFTEDMSVEDLIGQMRKIKKEYEIPAELLE